MADILKTDFLGHLRVNLDPQYLMERKVLEDGVWEGHVAYLISELVRPGNICADIGANVGLHSLAMALMTKGTGRVNAFEPSSLCFPRLAQNVKLNPELSDILRCHKLCVSDQPGTLKLFQSGDGSNAYVGPEYNPNLWTKGGPDDYELCEVVTIDDYLGCARLDFMKIDVEGMELEVLNGAIRTLEAFKPTIILETLLGNFDRTKIQKSENFLLKLGYRLFGTVPNQPYLIPVSFPKLPVDSIAIHNEKLTRYASLIVPFSIYRAELSIGNKNYESIEISIVDPPIQTIFAKFQQHEDAIILSSPAIVSTDAKSISTDERTKEWKCSFFFADSSHEKLSGSITIGANTWEIDGVRIIRAGSYVEPGL